MEVNMIVAAGRNGVIGRKGELIWHLPGDLKHFKTLTTGHVVIMGRKTWESLPKKPLPGRRNIVLTRNMNYKANGAETVSSPEEALEKTAGEIPFIIGGEEIYRLFLPYAKRLYLTEVDADCPDADAFLPTGLNDGDWETIEEGPWQTPENPPRFRYLTKIRKPESDSRE